MSDKRDFSMRIELNLCPCHTGESLFILPYQSGDAGARAHICSPADFNLVKTGSLLVDNEPLFTVSGFSWAKNSAGHFFRAPLAVALKDFPSRQSIKAKLDAAGYALAVITLSDKGAQGLRQDVSGPEIIGLLKSALDIRHCKNFLIPDDTSLLKALLADLALNQKFDLICTTGGTGLGHRDITPQTTVSILDYELPGFAQAMMAASLRITPNAAISRSVAGVAGKCLIINLPGSVKAVAENLAAIIPALPHALKKLNGDLADCGGLG